MKRIGIYAGSFDPPTNGHLWMIEQGAALFDELVVVLGENPDKRVFMSVTQRMDALRGMLAGGPANVRVEKMQGCFLVDFARRIGATHLLRGIRNTVDFEYEKSMDRMNARMEPQIRTIKADQLSLAIGREGQNARLAARLTGCKIDIKPE